MPTLFKNASAVGSPQYPAAIVAGMRRGQDPTGIMAERGIVIGQTRAGIEIPGLMIDDEYRRRAFEEDFSQIVEENTAAY